MAPRRPHFTLGIEEEYLIVERATGELAISPPPGFMAACREALGSQVTHELLQAQVEIGSSVCRDVTSLRRELAGIRRTIADCAAEFDLGLLAVSTHPSASWRMQKSVDLDRYRILTEDFQALARRLVICGMHIHAGIDDDELRIDLMNQVTYFLPHLLALSTSSPFWEGQDTGLKAFRPTIFGDLPRSGIPERFASFADWQGLLADLDEIGICDDPTKIWWDIRPSVKHPTLEMRVCDLCTKLEDAISIAAIYQSLLSYLYRLRATNQTWRHYRQMLLQENKWRAQRFGVGGTLADYGRRRLVPFAELMDELIDILKDDAEELGCLDELTRAREIVQGGTSADHQMRIYQAAIAAGAEPAEARRRVIDWLIDASLEGVPG